MIDTAYLLFLLFVVIVVVYALFIFLGFRKGSTGTLELVLGSVKNYSLIENAYQADVCPICLEEFEKDSLCRVLECRHLFHMLCIDEWLYKACVMCPMCQKT